MFSSFKIQNDFSDIYQYYKSVSHKISVGNYQTIGWNAIKLDIEEFLLLYLNFPNGIFRN